MPATPFSWHGEGPTGLGRTGLRLQRRATHGLTGEQRERESNRSSVRRLPSRHISVTDSRLESGDGSKIGPNVPMEYPTLDAAVHESLGREMMMNRRHKVWPQIFARRDFRHSLAQRDCRRPRRPKNKCFSLLRNAFFLSSLIAEELAALPGPWAVYSCSSPTITTDALNFATPLLCYALL